MMISFKKKARLDLELYSTAVRDSERLGTHCFGAPELWPSGPISHFGRPVLLGEWHPDYEDNVGEEVLLNRG
jgi:hypothetical protein